MFRIQVRWKVGLVAGVLLALMTIQAALGLAGRPSHTVIVAVLAAG